MANHLDACADDHVWQLRDVSFDMQIGALEDYECLRCGSFTVRQAAASRVVPA